MLQKCPKCGYDYDADATPGLDGACPRCVADFVKGNTEGVAPGKTGAASQPPESPFKPGDRIGDIEVIEQLGRGGMGYVFKARQPSLDRIVAVKVLDQRLAGDEEFASRFDREAKALAALNHPNILQVFDSGRDGDYCFIVMEYVDGVSLREVMSTGSLKPEAALRYVPKICDALEYAHSKGVIHRDIKPENILLDKAGTIKIADFGLARIAGRKGVAWGPLTVTGQAIGTPSYMAPEQMSDMARSDHRADIYSLGVVFYEMLTGELPLGRFPPPSSHVGVDVRLDSVVLRALESDPERRYQRVSEVKDAVTGIASGTSFDRSAHDVSSGETRLSRLAIAGVLGTPAGWGTFGLIYALCALFGERVTSQQELAAAILALIVAGIGVVLSIVALFAVARSSGRLRGRWLAVSGVVLPLAIVVLTHIYQALHMRASLPAQTTVQEAEDAEELRQLELRKIERSIGEPDGDRDPR